jgi:hypothetical protein
MLSPSPIALERHRQEAEVLSEEVDRKLRTLRLGVSRSPLTGPGRVEMAVPPAPLRGADGGDGGGGAYRLAVAERRASDAADTFAQLLAGGARLRGGAGTGEGSTASSRSAPPPPPVLLSPSSHALSPRWRESPSENGLLPRSSPTTVRVVVRRVRSWLPRLARTGRQGRSSVLSSLAG